MKARVAATAAGAFAIGALVAVSAFAMRPMWFGTAASIRPAWTEEPWPFLRDQWGAGKAFHCKAADCGSDVAVYVRAKVGFCNCTTGVADDEELDRISDFALFADRFVPERPGHEVSVAWTKGKSRSRAFSMEASQQTPQTVLSIGINDRCDAVVATAVAGGTSPEAIEPLVIDLLNSKPVLRWAEVTLGL